MMQYPMVCGVFRLRQFGQHGGSAYVGLLEHGKRGAGKLDSAASSGATAFLLGASIALSPAHVAYCYKYKSYYYQESGNIGEAIVNIMEKY